MRLNQAVLQGDMLRRSSWPEGLHVEASNEHSLSSHPLVFMDTNSDELEPPGRGCRLSLVMWDPKGRVLAKKDLAPGIYRLETSVVSFEIKDWQPSIEDLFATDWGLL